MFEKVAVEEKTARGILIRTIRNRELPKKAQTHGQKSFSNYDFRRIVCSMFISDWWIVS